MGPGLGALAPTGVGSIGDPLGATGGRVGECSASCATPAGTRSPAAAETAGGADPGAVAGIGSRASPTGIGTDSWGRPDGTDIGSWGLPAGTDTGSCGPPPAGAAAAGASAGIDTGSWGLLAIEGEGSTGAENGSCGPAAAGAAGASAGADTGSCGPPPAGGGGAAGSCGPPPAPGPGASGGVGPGSAAGPCGAPGAASGGCGVASTGASSGFPVGRPTGAPLAGGASILGKSPVRPSRFLPRSPPVLEISAKAPRALAIPRSPSAAPSPARPAASAPRAAAPAPSAAAPASPAPGAKSVATSKRFSPRPSPGRAVLQSSRCSNDLSICRLVSAASLGCRKELTRLPFHMVLPKPDHVAAAPCGSTKNHCGLRSARPSTMSTAPLRTPSFVFAHVSNTVATGFPTCSPKNCTRTPRTYFSDLTTRPSPTCITILIPCSNARASRPNWCSTALMSWAIFLISSIASPSKIKIASWTGLASDPNRCNRSRIWFWA